MTRRPPPDTDFSQTQHLDGWNKQGVQFVFGSGFILNSSSFTLEAWRADGTLQWSVPYSDTTAGNKTVTVSDAGNLHITGSWFGYQYYLITLDLNGSVLWRAPLAGGMVWGGTLAVAANGRVHATDGGSMCSTLPVPCSGQERAQRSRNPTAIRW